MKPLFLPLGLFLLNIFGKKHKNINTDNKMKDTIKAICVLTNTSSPTIKGTISFTEDIKNKETIIKVDIKGLTPGEHGFHIPRSW